MKNRYVVQQRGAPVLVSLQDGKPEPLKLAREHETERVVVQVVQPVLVEVMALHPVLKPVLAEHVPLKGGEPAACADKLEILVPLHERDHLVEERDETLVVQRTLPRADIEDVREIKGPVVLVVLGHLPVSVVDDLYLLLRDLVYVNDVPLGRLAYRHDLRRGGHDVPPLVKVVKAHTLVELDIVAEPLKGEVMHRHDIRLSNPVLKEVGVVMGGVEHVVIPPRDGVLGVNPVDLLPVDTLERGLRANLSGGHESLKGLAL